MKTPDEIRRHRDNLEVAIALPCGCRRGAHAAECHVGAKMMRATADTLSWVLGENDGLQDLVDRIEKEVADATASN